MHHIFYASKDNASQGCANLQVVAEHLFHEGKFAVGETFIQEAGIAEGESLKMPFEAMHQVLQEVPHLSHPKNKNIPEHEHNSKTSNNTWSNELPQSLELIYAHGNSRQRLHLGMRLNADHMQGALKLHAGIGIAVAPVSAPQLRSKYKLSCVDLQIHAHNLQPALQWVEEHRQELQKQPQAAGFEFKLYRLSFLHTLQQQGNSHK